MKYLQKDVCRLLNIKRETLRHYEKEGIVVPEIDPVNNYRWYDVEQVYMISECKRYQANEFSLAEIKQMLSRDTLDAYIARVEQKQAEFERKKEYYSKLADFNGEYLCKLKQIPQTLDQPVLSREEDILFACERRGNDLSLTPESVEANIRIRGDLSNCFIMSWFPERNSGYCEWGFGRRTENCTADQYGTIIPGGRAVTCTVDAGSEVFISPQWADRLFEYAKENNLVPRGDVLMLQLVRVTGGNDIHRYMEVILPLAE